MKREVDNTAPPKVEYFLRNKGGGLSSIIGSIRGWGKEFRT
ncbi:winged helix-turn-helix transcriptional regulator [Paenibacillus taichungensis]